MANRTASLYLNIRTPNGKWTFARPVTAKNNWLKPLVALVGGREEKHPEAKYYLFWYEGKDRRSKPLGQDPSLALTELEKLSRRQEYIAVGGEVRDDSERKRITIRDAAEQWIDDQKLFVGKDGQGMSRKTISAYRSRLNFFLEFCAAGPDYMDQLDEQILRDYIRFLQDDDEDFSDRYVYNTFQTLNTFLLANYYGRAITSAPPDTSVAPPRARKRRQKRKRAQPPSRGQGSLSDASMQTAALHTNMKRRSKKKGRDRDRSQALRSPNDR